MTVEVSAILQTVLGAVLTTSIIWIASRVQTMTTQVAIIIDQVQELRKQVISRELLEREITDLKSRLDTVEKSLDRLCKDFRKVEIEHEACDNCK